MLSYPVGWLAWECECCWGRPAVMGADPERRTLFPFILYTGFFLPRTSGDEWFFCCCADRAPSPYLIFSPKNKIATSSRSWGWTSLKWGRLPIITATTLYDLPESVFPVHVVESDFSGWRIRHFKHCPSVWVSESLSVQIPSGI